MRDETEIKLFVYLHPVVFVFFLKQAEQKTSQANHSKHSYKLSIPWLRDKGREAEMRVDGSFKSRRERFANIVFALFFLNNF
jgi:hypothetical protein